jgi:glutathionylspermidine synthase
MIAYRYVLCYSNVMTHGNLDTSLASPTFEMAIVEDTLHKSKNELYPLTMAEILLHHLAVDSLDYEKYTAICSRIDFLADQAVLEFDADKQTVEAGTNAETWLSLQATQPDKLIPAGAADVGSEENLALRFKIQQQRAKRIQKEKLTIEQIIAM